MPPYFRNFGKRLVKTPKLYFLGTGLAAGRPAGLWFWRDNTGNEVDLLFESGTRLQPVEIKSGATLVRDWLRGIEKWRAFAGEDALPGWLIYGGEDGYTREGVEVFPWRSIGAAAGRT